MKIILLISFMFLLLFGCSNEKRGQREENTSSADVDITSITSKWDWRGEVGSERILVPQLQLKLKNVSDVPIEHLVVKASFVNDSTREVFGDDLTPL